MEDSGIPQSAATHVFHSWSTHPQPDLPEIVGGSGSTFWDQHGNRYLDFSSQLVNLNLGHQHPRLVEAIVEQARHLCTVAPGFANSARSEAARLIAERAPGDLNSVFFTNGGAEAVENAMRMAKLATGRPKVLSAYRSYHGATAGAIALTGEPRRWASEPTIGATVKFFGPYLYRSAFDADTSAQECDRALGHLESVIEMEGPHLIAAVFGETVVGTNGVLVPPDGYLAGVRDLCDKYGILMVADEVMVGFGRLGEWFGVDHWDVVPDLIAFAKGVNSGYVPLGGVLIHDRVAAQFSDRAYPGGLTYSGHPLACAAAVESIHIFSDEAILQGVRRRAEEVITPALLEMARRHPSVGDVRGLGALHAVELVKNQTTREPLVPFNASGAEAAPMTEVLTDLKSRGVWPIAHFNGIHLAPPLVITDEELKSGLAALDESLCLADDFVVD